MRIAEFVKAICREISKLKPGVYLNPRNPGLQEQAQAESANMQNRV